MAQMSLAELYHGEGIDAKYGIMDEVMKDYFTNGYSSEYDEQTWLEMLIVKHTLITAEKMKIVGDTVLDLTDKVSPSSYERCEDDNHIQGVFIYLIGIFFCFTHNCAVNRFP